ncbi:hypothetical protein J2S43_000661 [Catenuloplanes nepalensis]|uniref:Uncharacterized protein n=1 Tax=Catenuloplanes nepalensis TaxID=587533 RepID=A0ABT9ML41_9ACTN|nr:hypothetical protein [Catenuloplanes nepalensis]MDP9792149.1 hypothetical protein [Catenuloplanes nepalensis]
MTHELRRLLEEELAGETPPPLGDVVRVSVDSGRRVRRRHRWFAGAGGGTAAVVLAVAGLFALGGPTGSAEPPTAESSPSLTVAAEPEQAAPAAPAAPERCTTPSPGVSTASDPAQKSVPARASAAASDGWGSGGLWMIDCTGSLRGIDLTTPSTDTVAEQGLSRTTPESALELLSYLVPKGDIGGLAYRAPAEDEAGSTFVQMYLDRGEGYGMIRLHLAGPEPRTDGLASRLCVAMRSCVNMPGVGLLVVENNPDECTLFQRVSFYRADGVMVSLMLGDCLMWDGRQNPPGQVALSLQEAVTVVLNPQWGPEMPADLVKAGAINQPELPTIVGG